MKFFTAALLTFALTIAALPSQGQTPGNPIPAQQDDTITVSTSEVTIDVIVRDKRGRPVKNLLASDFEVFEDGARQEVQSFRPVTRASETPNSTATTAAGSSARPSSPRSNRPTGSVAGVSAIALVFDRLSPDARARAREAALSFASSDRGTNDFVGVFAIDQSLRVLQPYTTDARLVKAAISNAGAQGSSVYASTTGQTRALSERQEALERSTSTVESAAAGAAVGRDASAAQSAGANMAEQMFAEMTRRSLESFEELERDQQGYATTNGLLAVIDSMRRLPGRKAVIFFSEGIAIPPAVQAYFRSIINTANRAGVSIYAVDAAGLRVTSGNEETRNEINSRSRRRMSQLGSAVDPTGRPLTMELERNEDLLRLNPHSGLGQLADQTGGLLISETNNIGARLRQVDEDLSAYYLLSYVPKNQNYDGRFRQVEVKLNRTSLDVQARKGYYAINAATSSPVLPYEAPALAALGSTNRPNAFPMRFASFNFPEAARPGLVSVLVEVPARTVTFAPVPERKEYKTDFSVVVLVKDEKQQVVKKLSNQYLLSGSLDRREAAERSETLFYREAELPPGRYTVEAAIYDRPTARASVRTGSVEVPNADEAKLRLSSIVLVGRAEQLKADGRTNNPFQYGEVLLYPNLGTPLSKGVNKQLTFFFTVYAAKGSTASPKMSIEILRNNQPLARLAADLPVPDAQGRIQYASALPLEKFQPGAYDLKVTVNDGQSSQTRIARFDVAP